MLTAEMYARARGLMYDSCHNCEDCPLYGHLDELQRPISCLRFPIIYPAEAVKRDDPV